MSPLNHSLSEPHPDLEVCVILPAKDEAARLERTLRALSRQRDLKGTPLPAYRWEVILLVNNSSDGSFELARKFQTEHLHFCLHVVERELPAKDAHIGKVRRLLLDSAAERLLVRSKPHSLMLSTDGDTEVAPDWIAQNLREVCQGAEAVGGRIEVQPFDLAQLDAQTRRIHSESDRYNLLVSWLEDQCDPQAHDPWPRHYQHFGGSFAVKPEVYRQVGGLPVREYLEDLALYEALIRQDVKFRHSPVAGVRTAGRLEGRTAVGLAEQLTRWREGPSSIPVPSVYYWRKLFLLRKRVRSFWLRAQAGVLPREPVLENLAEACAINTEQLRDALACCWFGEAFESLDLQRRLREGLLPGEVYQPLEEAVHQLEHEFKQFNAVLRSFEVPDAMPLRQV